MARASNLAALAGLAAAGYMASRGRGEKGEKAPVEDRSMMERKADRIPETPETPETSETPEAKVAAKSDSSIDEAEDMREAINKLPTTPRVDPKVKPVATSKAKPVTTASNPSKVAAAMQSAPMSNGPDNTSAVTGRTTAPRKMSMEPATSTARPDTGYRRMSDRDRAIFDIQQQAPTQFNQNKKTGGSIKGMKKGGLARGGMAAPMMASGGKMKDKMGGMPKMPDGKMMKDSAMKKSGMPMKDGKPAFMKKFVKGGGIESRGKTKGTVIRMASGGSVSSASRRADGIAQRGKTRC